MTGSARNSERLSVYRSDDEYPNPYPWPTGSSTQAFEARPEDILLYLRYEFFRKNQIGEVVREHFDGDLEAFYKNVWEQSGRIHPPEGEVETKLWDEMKRNVWLLDFLIYEASLVPRGANDIAPHAPAPIAFQQWIVSETTRIARADAFDKVMREYFKDRFGKVMKVMARPWEANPGHMYTMPVIKRDKFGPNEAVNEVLINTREECDRRIDALLKEKQKLLQRVVDLQTAMQVRENVVQGEMRVPQGVDEEESIDDKTEIAELKRDIAVINSMEGLYTLARDAHAHENYLMFSFTIDRDTHPAQRVPPKFIALDKGYSYEKFGGAAKQKFGLRVPVPHYRPVGRRFAPTPPVFPESWSSSRLREAHVRYIHDYMRYANLFAKQDPYEKIALLHEEVSMQGNESKEEIRGMIQEVAEYWVDVDGAVTERVEGDYPSDDDRGDTDKNTSADELERLYYRSDSEDQQPPPEFPVQGAPQLSFTNGALRGAISTLDETDAAILKTLPKTPEGLRGNLDESIKRKFGKRNPVPKWKKGKKGDEDTIDDSEGDESESEGSSKDNFEDARQSQSPRRISPAKSPTPSQSRPASPQRSPKKTPSPPKSPEKSPPASGSLKRGKTAGKPAENQSRDILTQESSPSTTKPREQDSERVKSPKKSPARKPPNRRKRIRDEDSSEWEYSSNSDDDDDDEETDKRKRRNARKSPAKANDGPSKERKVRSEKSKSPDDNALADILFGAVSKAWLSEELSLPVLSQESQKKNSPRKTPSPKKKRNVRAEDSSEWEDNSSSEEDDEELVQKVQGKSRKSPGKSNPALSGTDTTVDEGKAKTKTAPDKEGSKSPGKGTGKRKRRARDDDGSEYEGATESESEDYDDQGSSRGKRARKSPQKQDDSSEEGDEIPQFIGTDLPHNPPRPASPIKTPSVGKTQARASVLNSSQQKFLHGEQSSGPSSGRRIMKVRPVGQRGTLESLRGRVRRISSRGVKYDVSGARREVAVESQPKEAEQIQGTVDREGETVHGGERTISSDLTDRIVPQTPQRGRRKRGNSLTGRMSQIVNRTGSFLLSPIKAVGSMVNSLVPGTPPAAESESPTSTASKGKNIIRIPPPTKRPRSEDGDSDKTADHEGREKRARRGLSPLVEPQSVEKSAELSQPEFSPRASSLPPISPRVHTPAHPPLPSTPSRRRNLPKPANFIKGDFGKYNTDGQPQISIQDPFAPPVDSAGASFASTVPESDSSFLKDVVSSSTPRGEPSRSVSESSTSTEEVSVHFDASVEPEEGFWKKIGFKTTATRKRFVPDETLSLKRTPRHAEKMPAKGVLRTPVLQEKGKAGKKAMVLFEEDSESKDSGSELSWEIEGSKNGTSDDDDREEGDEEEEEGEEEE